MKINFKKIKTLLLLSALCIFEQSYTWAMEVEEPEKRGMKRLLEQYNPICIFDALDDGTLKKTIFIYLDLKGDQEAILALSASNIRMNRYWDKEYKQAIQEEHPWQDNLNLTARALYIHNTHLLKMLGLHVNISQGWAEERDRIRFEKLCSQFERSPFLKETSLPRKYMNLLHLHLATVKPTVYQTPMQAFLQQKYDQQRLILVSEFDRVMSISRKTHQNEQTLYFHFIQFVLNTPQLQIVAILNSPLYKSLNNSFMAVLNSQLSTLKLTPGLNTDPQFADVWQQIIGLEPAPTIWQFDQAAQSFLDRAAISNDFNGKARYFVKSAKLYEEQIKVIQATGGNPTAVDYGNLAHAFFEAGNFAQDAHEKVRYFIEADKYYEVSLQIAAHKKHILIIHEHLAVIHTFLCNHDKANYHNQLAHEFRRGG